MTVKKRFSAGLRKQKMMTVRIESNKAKAVQEKCDQVGIKSIRQLFDIAIVGGLVFRNAKAIEYVQEHKAKEKERFRSDLVNRLQGIVSKKQSREEYKCGMYLQDHQALCNYFIEANVKKQWVWNILLVDAFLNDEPFIKELIERWKALDISARQAAVARLEHDHAIEAFSKEEADKILEQATKEYDARIFDSSIENMIKAKLDIDKHLKEQEEDDDLDRELDRKNSALKAARNIKINQIIEPKEEE